MTTVPFLAIEDVHTYYGESHILHGISFDIPSSQILGLFGRNGVGKTTTMQTILGLPPPRSGKIALRGETVSGLPMHQIVRRGIGWVPQGRRIFKTLRVEENLVLAAGKARPGSWSLERIYHQFPILLERRRSLGERLSGGEQQMLAIARALIQNPELLLMDEPAEGLAPIIVQQIGEIILRLKESGCAILLVEQNLSFGLPLVREVLIMNKGQIVFKGTPEMLSNNIEVTQQFLGVTAKNIS